MAIFKCKMCGGQLEIAEGTTVCTCDYCGTEQTLPRLDSDKKANLYDRANHFRRNNDFDKAMSIYEQILNEDSTDAEAYWSLVICKYGIEYVEDPTSHKRIPTVNRAQFTSIYDDENYKQALANADVLQKVVYEQEANAINEIQKGILAISSKEEPFDVFICYKESDENGRRTPDSVLANDLYHQLTQEGFKVFFARITLEDKLGQEYEPYIFAALNSSKVMLVLGTKPEYYKAVWVKNEWSRYLALIRQGEKKMLIPAYKDMDPYDLPEEFSHLQAQDMSKLGFMQDLIRGIKKILGADQPKAATETVVVQQNANSNVSALIKRGNMALEDKEWDKADGFFEEVLNQDAENGDAYFGKLLVSYKCSDVAELKNKLIGKYTEVTNRETYNACEADNAHIQGVAKEKCVLGQLEEKEIIANYNYDLRYVSVVENRKEQKEKQLSELNADKLLNRCKSYATGDSKQRVDDIIHSIHQVLDERIAQAQSQDEENIQRIIIAYRQFICTTDEKINELYNEATTKREDYYRGLTKEFEKASSLSAFETVKKKLLEMDGYKDTKEVAEKCDEQIARIKREQEEEAERLRKAEIRKAELKTKKKKKRIIITIASVVTVIVICITARLIILNNKYNHAMSLKESGQYQEAYEEFDSLGGYKDSDEQMHDEKMLQELAYNDAVALKEQGQYREAYEKFDSLGGYKDSDEQMRDEKMIQGLMQSAGVGDVVIFGDYNGANEWRVLEKTDNKLLLISEECIDKRPYNERDESITWKTCTLRSWLNGTYYKSAFNEIERSMIVRTKVVNTYNVEYGTWGGQDTEDYVFLLSIAEAEKYFLSDSDRVAYNGGDTQSYWLRSPGFVDRFATFVVGSGYVNDFGSSANLDGVGIRPALWVNLDY